MVYDDRRLLALLQDKQFLTGAQLAQKLGISERTVRTKLRELEETLKRHGASLEAKRRVGYRLVIHDQESFAVWLAEAYSESTRIPETSEERVKFIISYLLNHDEYIKLEDFSTLLYVSRNTVTADLKLAEGILARYHLKVCRRPNYGIRLEGEEFNYRICIARHLVSADFYARESQNEGALLRLILSSTIKELHLPMTEGSFRAMLRHLYVANERIRHGHPIVYSDSVRENLKQNLSSSAFQAAQKLVQKLEQRFQLHYDLDEILYQAIHLSGKVTSDVPREDSVQRISREMETLATQMLEVVYQSNRVDFRNDRELHESLVQHLVPLDTRIRFDIPLTNPILEHVKTEYSFAFVLAANACTILRKYYQKTVPQGEIGYIAILFCLALEKRDKGYRKKNIVVVCASGRGTSQLFLYKCRQTLERYIDHIYECNIFDLPELDYKGLDIDCIFSTIKLNMHLPVPVYSVSPLLDSEETGRIQRILQGGEDDYLPLYFDARLFLPRLEGKSKTEILQQICDHIGQFKTLDPDFYSLVLKREEMGLTDFGNLVAIPHAYRIASPDQFVMAAILDKPIWWGHNEAQVILLVSLPESNTENVERFYRAMLNFQSDPALVGRLIESPKFSTLMQVFREAGQR